MCMETIGDDNFYHLLYLLPNLKMTADKSKRRSFIYIALNFITNSISKNFLIRIFKLRDRSSFESHSKPNV